MDPRLFFALPLVTALGVTLAFGEARRESTEDLDAIRWLAAVPWGDLATPLPGPAVYRGELEGPPGRTSIWGEPAAASWWWVDSSDEDHRDVHCFERHRDHLALRDGERTVPLDFFGPNVDDVALVAEDRWEAGHAVIDLGRLPEKESDVLPGPAAACAGEGRKAHERWIPAGIRVEVVACYRDGILGPCVGAPLRGVVAVGGAAGHRVRRAREVQARVRFAGLFAVIVLLTVTLVLAGSDPGAPRGEGEATS